MVISVNWKDFISAKLPRYVDDCGGEDIIYLNFTEFKEKYADQPRIHKLQ